MPAAYQDQYLEQGTTFNVQMTLADNTGAAYNLVGFSVSAQAKKSYYTSNVALNFATTYNDAANGIITITADSKQTANVWGTLVYDVILTENATNNVTRVIEGQIYVDPGVTGMTGMGY